MKKKIGKITGILIAALLIIGFANSAFVIKENQYGINSIDTTANIEDGQFYIK